MGIYGMVGFLGVNPPLFVGGGALRLSPRKVSCTAFYIFFIAIGGVNFVHYGCTENINMFDS